MAKKSGLDSHVVEMRAWEVGESGLGMYDFVFDVSVGLNVTMLPLWRPKASCFPLGDQLTKRKCNEHTHK